MNPVFRKLGAAVGLPVLALASVLWALKPARPLLDKELHGSVGRVLAEEASARLGGRGRLVVVVPEAPFDLPLVDAQYGAFRRNVAKGVQIVAEAPIRLEQMGPLDGLLTPDIYFGLAAKHPGVDAMVSFVGLGEFRDEDLAKVAGGMPPLYVVSVNVPVAEKLFAKGLVQLAVGRHRKPGTGESGRSGREAFDRVYEVVTPELAAHARK